MIAIGCDHGGYDLKLEIIKYLEREGLAYKDFGCNGESVDYPIYARKVGQAVLDGECEKGILICGTGIGISIAANKMKGIRCALCSDCFSAEATRLHNDANIIALGGRVLGPELAVKIVDTFLKTPFSGDERHVRRISMIEEERTRTRRKSMSKVYVMDHPLIQHKVGIIRREEVGSKDFRQMISEIAMLMCYESTRNLKLQDVKIKTPICETTVKELAGKKLAVVPILRAGLGMVEGMLAMIPAAKVGHIGLYRDPETLEPVEYYCKLPSDCNEREVYVVDPMLATGGSCVAAIQMLKEKGVKNIHFMCIIASPEGVERLQKEQPDVDIYIAALDEKLNDHGYIVPGLGDAGDRIFGTK